MVALTFDDGPDLPWTAAALDGLAHENVPARFFSSAPASRRTPSGYAESSPKAMRSATTPGRTPTSQGCRPGGGGLSCPSVSLGSRAAPYSSEPQAIGPRERAVLQEETKAGYLVVLSDRDTEDWRRPGVAEIGARTVSVGEAGQVVLLHDAGGDRSHSVQALPEIIARYRAAGFRFTTVSGG